MRSTRWRSATSDTLELAERIVHGPRGRAAEPAARCSLTQRSLSDEMRTTRRALVLTLIADRNCHFRRRADLGSDLDSFFNDLNFSNMTQTGRLRGPERGLLHRRRRLHALPGEELHPLQRAVAALPGRLRRASTSSPAASRSSTRASSSTCCRTSARPRSATPSCSRSPRSARRSPRLWSRCRPGRRSTGSTASTRARPVREARRRRARGVRAREAGLHHGAGHHLRRLVVRKRSGRVRPVGFAARPRATSSDESA